MAQGIVAKIWNIKAGGSSGGRSAATQISASLDYIENPEKVGVALPLEEAQQLSNQLTYVANDMKTVDGLYMGARHIADIQNATAEMMEIKEFYGKLDGRVATHGIISLDEFESDIKNAGKLMLLVEELMQEIFPQHQVVYAVHTNTENLHVHFVINTVGLDGKKIHMDKKFMSKVFEPALNKLAEKYGFTPNAEWKKEKKPDPIPLPTRKILLRKLIDYAIEQTDTFDAFIAYLREEGLVVNVGKNLSVRMDEMSHAIRTGQLGEEYTISAIYKRLSEKYEPFKKGQVGSFYEQIMPVEMANITPTKMKKYKDMSREEKVEAVRLLRLGRNPWSERFHDNWQMRQLADELNQIGYVYKLVHHYSKGSDNSKSAMEEIVNRREEISKEIKEIRKELRHYKPITDIYEELKQYMVRAYMFDVYGRTEYVSDFLKYRELSDRLEKSYGKTVEEVAEFLMDRKGALVYLKEQNKELSLHYKAIYKHTQTGAVERFSEKCSFFHMVGHSEALYQAREYGIYASDIKYLTSEELGNKQIRVVTMPTTVEGKPTISTVVSVLDEKGRIIKGLSSAGISEKEFNKRLYKLQEEYQIKKCTASKEMVQGISKKI